LPSLSRVGPIGPNPPSGSTGRLSPSAIALRSAPAQNAPPAPVSTATSAFGSESKRWKASNKARAVARSTALRLSGRSIVTTVTRWSVWVETLPWLASRMARFSTEGIAG
jgi:hypothetical protein